MTVDEAEDGRLLVERGMGGGSTPERHMIRRCSLADKEKKEREQSGNSIPTQSTAGEMLWMCACKGSPCEVEST